MQHQDHPAAGALGLDVLTDPLRDGKHVAHPRQKDQQVPSFVARSVAIDALEELNGGSWEKNRGTDRQEKNKNQQRGVCCRGANEFVTNRLREMVLTSTLGVFVQVCR